MSPSDSHPSISRLRLSCSSLSSSVPSSPPLPSVICWFSTIEYTLAFSSVKTKLVFRSRPRRPSRIAALGALERVNSRPDIWLRTVSRWKCVVQWVRWGCAAVHLGRTGVVVQGKRTGRRRKEKRTVFKFSNNRAYSSKTSCSSGERVSSPSSFSLTDDCKGSRCCCWSGVSGGMTASVFLLFLF